ncbi:MAG: imidazole glycerol phosphate synthase subunit HisF [Bacteroidetes bacterium GWE2_29_8]|nr:MAG: imidazole glycerol phosphate synthase subunit HisF [Bacteroidetes bacterium GWE2_29_8]OFY14432.1 MAG: imidazole glycerol phosphate synthase subunit HisF [Bacteroidetes bacterium GWF2_29_10]
MLAKRIIPCLDIRDGRTVKGINFENIKDAGDPVDLGYYYSCEGADELVFLDITATIEKRKTFVELVKRIASTINIPFTVGGGINSINDIDVLLNSGADKVSINSSAVRNPEIITQVANTFGSQCCVIAIDAKFEEGTWFVYLNGGRLKTERNLHDWAKEAEDRGAGEILFTSMNNDGTKNGFAIEALKELAVKRKIPIIASGGAGTMEHFEDVFKNANVDAALAASIFHYNEINIKTLKDFLRKREIIVR